MEASFFAKEGLARKYEWIVKDALIGKDSDYNLMSKLQSDMITGLRNYQRFILNAS